MSVITRHSAHGQRFELVEKHALFKDPNTKFWKWVSTSDSADLRREHIELANASLQAVHGPNAKLVASEDDVMRLVILNHHGRGKVLALSGYEKCKDFAERFMCGEERKFQIFYNELSRFAEENCFDSVWGMRADENGNLELAELLLTFKMKERESGVKPKLPPAAP